jgi:nucleoside-diphosphate-sugar epimerase
MNILLTGAAGYTGRGIAAILNQSHHVRSLDINDAPVAAASVIGDLANLDVCRGALTDIDAAVLCHMAPNPTGYATPELAIDVNVKGTTNLYHAAVERGIKRFVLISSTGVLRKEPRATAVPGDGPYNFHYSLYVLTKIMQEDIARFYHEMHGISTVILRPGWIVYDEDFTTKYGQKMEYYDPGLIDPRDIGTAAQAALALPDPGLEAIDIGQDDSGFDLTPAHERLGWTPRYRFTGLPRK